MTKVQQRDNEVLEYIAEYVSNMKRTPSLRDIGKAVGYASPRSVQLSLGRLHKEKKLLYKKGIIYLNEGHVMDKDIQRLTEKFYCAMLSNPNTTSIVGTGQDLTERANELAIQFYNHFNK